MVEIKFPGKIGKQSIYSFFDYFFIATIIALTGFEFFFRDKTILYLVVGPIGFVLFILKGEKISAKLLSMLCILLFLFLLQSLTFNLPYSIAFNGALRFFIYFSIVSIVGVKFNKIFTNIIYYTCITSLCIYFSTIIFPDFRNLLLTISKNITSLNTNSETYNNWSNPSQNIIIYVIPLINDIRNCGPFWEPGMFAIFINIALVINLITNKKLLEKKNVSFIIASITTLSTTSLITTFIIISYHFLFSKKLKYSIIFLIIIPFITIPVFNSELIKGKIESNLDTMDTSYSRFGAILVHFNEILKSPIIGHGSNINKSLDNELDEFDTNISPSGLTNIVRYYGIPFSILFYLLLFRTSTIISKIAGSTNKYDAILIFIVLLIVTFSQDATTRHFYLFLIMMPISNKMHMHHLRKLYIRPLPVCLK